MFSRSRFLSLSLSLSYTHTRTRQLEGVQYACQRHQLILPGGTRAGFFLGDGAGVRKNEHIHTRTHTESHTHTHTHIHTHTHTPAHCHTQAHTHMHARAHTHTQAHTHTHTHTNVCVHFVCVCLCVCVCVQVGKGRQISGIIADNLARGRGQHVWLSTSSDLRLDAQRDLQDLGIHCKVIDGCQDLDLNTKALGLGSEFKEGGRVCVYVRKHLHAHTNERAHTHMHYRTKPLVFPSLFPLSFSSVFSHLLSLFLSLTRVVLSDPTRYSGTQCTHAHINAYVHAPVRVDFQPAQHKLSVEHESELYLFPKPKTFLHLLTCTGVLFSTYSTLIGSARGTKSSRIDQIIKWCGGEKFDGLLVFDECHRAKNFQVEAHICTHTHTQTHAHTLTCIHLYIHQCSRTKK